MNLDAVAWKLFVSKQKRGRWIDDLFNLYKVAEDFTKIMSYYFAKPYLLLPTATEHKYFYCKKLSKIDKI